MEFESSSDKNSAYEMQDNDINLNNRYIRATLKAMRMSVHQGNLQLSQRIKNASKVTESIP
jgi:hypothetical protein